MKRSLVLLLVVALLAMMIPSMAFADAQGTLTIKGTTPITQKLKNTDLDQAIQNDVKVEVTSPDDNYHYWRLYYDSRDEDVVRIYDNDDTFPTYDDTPVERSLPALYAYGVGTATITVDLQEQDDDWNWQTVTSTSFDVKLEEIPLKSIKFDSEGTVITEGADPINVADNLRYDPADATYQGEGLLWSVDNGEVASVSNAGVLTPKKPGTVKVTATIKGLDPASFVVTVKEKEPEKKVPYTSIKFSTKQFELKPTDYVYDSLLDLNDYLTYEKPEGCNDDFVWSCSDPQIARVDDGYVYSKGSRMEGTVEITCASKLDPAKVNDSVKIVFKKAEPIEELKFTKEALSVKLNDTGLDLGAYLEVVKPEKWNDKKLWTSSNPEIIDVDDNGVITLSHTAHPGDVTITARSQRNPKATASIKLTLVKEKLTSISFTKDVPTSMKYSTTLDPWKYIDTDPYYYADYYSDEIGWESSDPQVAYFDGSEISSDNVGKATLTAYSLDDPSVKGEFTLEVLPNPVTDVKFGKEQYTLKVDDELELYASKNLKLLPRDHSNDCKLYFQSSDPEVVSIIGNYAEANKAGTATITLTIRNADDSVVEKSFTVTVTDTALTGIAFKKEAYTVNMSKTIEVPKPLYLKLTPVDADIDWNDMAVASSDPEIVMVSGLNRNYVEVTPQAPGKATITVSSRSNPAITATTTVTVAPIALKAVKFEGKIEKKKRKITALLYEGGDLEQNEIEVKAKVSPADAYFEDKWETSDASVAYVSGNTFNGPDSPSVIGGIISKSIVLAGPGTCTIKLTVTDGTTTKTRSFKLTVKAAKVSKLALSQTKATAYLVKGGDNTLQLEAYDAKTNYAVPVTWASSNKKIATVDRFGLVTFKKAGKVKISATTKDGNKTKKYCTLTVKQLKVTKITPVNKTITLRVGQEKPVKVTITPAKAYNPVLAYKSSKPKVVTVDSEGNLIPLMPGKSVITITAKDGSKKTAKVTVVVKAAVINNDVKVDAIEDGMDLSFEGDVLNGIGDISNLEIDGGIGLTIE